MATDTIRIIIADDHPVVRAGLRAMLHSAKDLTVLSEAVDGEQAVALVSRLKPDVIVMDLTMAKLDGIRATERIVSQGMSTRVLILTSHSEEEFLVSALEAGAAGYLVKSATEHEIVDAIRALAHGDMYVQPRAARVFADRIRGAADAEKDATRFALLTDRERDVLRLIAEGYCASTISERLSISVKTVETYKRRIAEKISVAGRPAFVWFSLRVGLLTQDGACADLPSACASSLRARDAATALSN